MKATIFLVVLASIVIGVPAGCMLMMNEDELVFQQRQSDWLHFSMEHHCKIVREPDWSKPQTLWQCDGNFQVER